MFELAKDGQVATIYIDKGATDYKGLYHVAQKIQEDVKSVTGLTPQITSAMADGYTIIAGTIGENPTIDEMIASGVLDVSEIAGKRESFGIRLIGDTKLIIAGTETVSTLHGMYHISSQIGVSPWVYWADVVPAKQDEILFDDTIDYSSKEPSVKYRGFFMNDEWPSLGAYVFNTFGDFNVKFYDKVFDLLLRLKGNYFWPAMWSASLSLDGGEDDPLANVKLATELGITIGNSHHEPLMRSSEEWDKVKSDTNNEGYGKDWNYYTNGEGLYRYWEDGVERNKDFKHMITIGMRGERDTTMLPPGSSIQENVELLRRIITDQLEIIKGKGCDQLPKMLALYKEVEGYYYGGDGVEGLKDWEGLDDTILLLSDDNFANVRTLPTAENRDRKAGWGLYYHFDYHGAPVSYEWVNSTPLPKAWEQLTMAYEYGIRDLWIVNVGDLRPQELPLSYFMELAYDYEGMGIDHPNETEDFVRRWVEQQFGATISDPEIKDMIADVLIAYARMHGNRKPEVTYPDTYHITHYDENDMMIDLCNRIIDSSGEIQKNIPAQAQDAFYSLVYYPAVAGANVQLMNLYAAKNQFCATYGVAVAEYYAKRVADCIKYDEELTKYYNETMANGKWKGMMSSAHIGFKHWNDEDWQYPQTKDVVMSEADSLHVLVAYADSYISEGNTRLPEFTSTGQEKYVIHVANGRDQAMDVSVQADHQAVCIRPVESDIGCIRYYEVSICWDQLKEDLSAIITVTGAGSEVKVSVSAILVDESQLPDMTFVERDGVTAIEAEHYAEHMDVDGYRWTCLRSYGKSLSSMKVYPLDRNFEHMGEGPSLTYNVCIRQGGEYTLRVITAPTNNLEDGRNMRYAVSADDGEICAVKTILDEHYNIGDGHARDRDWAEGVLNNCHYGESTLTLTPGLHSITLYGVEAGLVLQKLVLYKDTLPESYFGPIENGYVKK